MLIGFVSDERYVGLAGVAVELQQAGQTVAATHSTARGAIFAEVTEDTYEVTFAKDGYGSKRVEVEVRAGQPHAFRLLSDRLLGYVWPKWARSGERGEFRVHSVEPYRLALYRYGIKREFVKLLGWFDEHGPRATMQITPDGDYSQTGVGWNRVGYGSPHHTQFVEAPEQSGLYYFHARSRAGAFFAFPWVVAPAVPRARIAVLSSTNTWCAYNNFGGRSNYVNATGLPEDPTVNARQDLRRYAQTGSFNEWMFPDDAYMPLSFDRPEPGNCVREDEEVTDPIEGRSECHLAPAEWRLLGWLEREGYGYDLYADYHLHSGELPLDAYNVLVLTPHPEYWSRAMYDRVHQWVYEGGGKLLYLGGNGVNCEVEFAEDAAIRCKSQLLSPAGAMSTAGTQGEVHESRFHRTAGPEAALLGVVCTDAGIMTAAPYRVIDPGHWAFAGTGLREGDLFGTQSLHERCHGGASGHETDKRSANSPPGTVLLAKGLNPEEGGAELVYYETDSGGAAFSAGSITYAASLLVDDVISQITKTVLERLLS
jgi:N,N-dimethylformamidase